MLNIRYIAFILAFSCLSAMLNHTYGQGEGVLETLFTQVLNATSPTEKEELINRLIQEAEKHQNNVYLCEAYFQKLIIGYNSYNIQEAKKWIELLEPLALKEKRYYLYFRAKQCFIDLMLMEGDLEKGEEEAKKMLAEAIASNHPGGIVVAHLCLSHAYTMSYRERQTAEELEKAYRIASRMQTQPDFDAKQQFGINQEIIHALITSYSKLEDKANHLKYLKKQEELLRTRLQQHPNEAASIEPSLNLAYILFVSYYLKNNALETAGRYLDSSKRHFSNNFSSMYKAFYYEGSLKYYEAAEDYPNALWCIDSLLNSARVDLDQYAFQATKARILWKAGTVKDAASLYEKTMLLQDSLYAALLNKQIEQIRQTDENNKILLEKERLQNYINLSLLLAVLVGLIMLIWYISHTIKIKNSLKKAEQEMRLMSRQMEVANIAKDKFLSNISQTISTPLNTIVATSSELADSNIIPPEKKEELSAIVLKTTEALMVLINNILDLSRLEAGMMKFLHEKISPVSQIKLFLGTASGRKVSMSYQVPEHELEKHLITFDSGKFSQLLDSIFTKEKDLGMSFNIKSNRLEMTIIGSDLSSNTLTQDVIIQNEINLLLVRHFQGEYQIHPEQAAIGITFPVSRES